MYLTRKGAGGPGALRAPWGPRLTDLDGEDFAAELDVGITVLLVGRLNQHLDWSPHGDLFREVVGGVRNLDDLERF